MVFTVPGIDGNMSYGILEEIIKFSYLSYYSVVLFKCKWFEANPNKKNIIKENNITSIAINSKWYEDEPYILGSQAKRVFHMNDFLNDHNQRIIVGDLTQQARWDILETPPNVIDEVPVLQTSNSFNFVFTVELGELEFINLTHVDEEPQDVNVLPNYIYVSP